MVSEAEAWQSRVEAALTTDKISLVEMRQLLETGKELPIQASLTQVTHAPSSMSTLSPFFPVHHTDAFQSLCALLFESFPVPFYSSRSATG